MLWECIEVAVGWYSQKSCLGSSSSTTVNQMMGQTLDREPNLTTEPGRSNINEASNADNLS